MERWLQHYSELYSKENVAAKEALNAIECLLVLEGLDRKTTLEELTDNLNLLASGKAIGKENSLPKF